MGELNVDDVRLMLEDPVASRAQREKDRLDVIAMTPDTQAQELRAPLTPTDAAALTREVGEHLVAAARSGLPLVGRAGGTTAWPDLTPWGFELESIRTPVLIR